MQSASSLYPYSVVNGTSRFALRLIGPVAAVMLLAGCAVNTIRIDRATAMGKAGTAATDGTQKLMDQVRAANREVLIDLVATDPGCTLPVPRIAGGAASDGSILCRRGPAQERDFEIRRWSAREFKPSLAVIDGLAVYLGAVDAVVTRKPVDIAGEVADAEAKLRGLVDDLGTLTGAPALPALDADQTAAIKGTLDLLSEILDESRKVDDLRKIELELDPQAFAANLDALAKVNETMVRALNGQISHQRTLTMLQLGRLQDTSPDNRKPVVARQMELIELQETVPELGQALAQSVAAFRQAHADYRALLFDSGAGLSKEEKRKAARITQARVLAALHNLASLVKAF